MKTGGLRLAIASQKGGVGKTTLAANLAVALRDLEFRTLLVEVDPQGSLIRLFGLDRFDLQQGLFGAIRGERPAAESLEHLHPSLDLLPSNVWSHEEEVQFLETAHRDPRVLERILEPLLETYDYVVLDLPPGLGPLTRAGLAAADRYLVPVQAESMNLGTLPRLEQLVQEVRATHNPNLALDGYVATMVDGRTRHAAEVLDTLRQHHGASLLHTVIPRSIRVAEESGRGKPTLASRPRSRAGRAFGDLAEELLSRHARERVTTAGPGVEASRREAWQDALPPLPDDDFAVLPSFDRD